MVNYFDSLQQLLQSHRINNSKQKHLTNQEWNIIDPQPISEIMNGDLDFIVSHGLTKTEQRVLDLFFRASFRHKRLYFSQTFIGDQVGVGRQWTNKIIKKLVAMGLIAKRWRYDDTCEYKVSSFFQNPHIRSRFAHIFRAFRFLSLSLLTSIPGYASQQATLIKSQGYMESNNSARVREGDKKMLSSDEKSTILEQLSRGVFKGNPIDQSVRNLIEFHFTRWAQIKLSAFPPEAINHTRSAMAALQTQPRSVFNYFYISCKNYCEVHEIQPDWAWANALAKAYGMPDSPQWTFDHTKPPRRYSSIAMTLHSSRTRASSDTDTTNTTRSGIYKMWVGHEDKNNFVEQRQRRQLAIQADLAKMSPEDRESTEKRRAAYVNSLQQFKPKHLE